MDAIFFEAKRAHYGAMKLMRPLMRAAGLTPARFDLMYLVAESARMTQSALRKALGVARATISEMLASLERIGLVVRERATDKRTWSVRLTPKGLASLLRASDHGIHNGFVSVTIDAALSQRDAECDIFRRRDEVWTYLHWLRVACGDTARRDVYEWDLDLIEGELTTWP